MITFRSAKRDAVNCLIALAGSSGSGKTFSALELANGLSGGVPFAAIDAENRRMLHYAEGYGFRFDYAELEPPYSPQRYAEAIRAADDAGYPVIVIDSFTHEWDGIGGCHDIHDDEEDKMVARIMEKRQDAKEWEVRASVNVGAWKAAKDEHRRLMAHILKVRAHLIFCLRADNGKIEMVRNAEGKTEIQPKKVLGWASEWIPITEKRFIYEMTTSLVLSPDAPGVPIPIKLQDQHRAFFPQGKQIDAEAGRRLAAWAKGTPATPPTVEDTLREIDRVTAAAAMTEPPKDRPIMSVLQEWKDLWGEVKTTADYQELNAVMTKPQVWSTFKGPMQKELLAVREEAKRRIQG